jgi:hypothetical protein
MRTVTESMLPIMRTTSNLWDRTLSAAVGAIRGMLRRTPPARSGPRVRPMVRGLAASGGTSLTMTDGAGSTFESVRLRPGLGGGYPVASNAPAWDGDVRAHRYG